MTHLQPVTNYVICQENEIAECASVEKLSALKESLEGQHSAVLRTVFAWLFPFGPAWNSILGTFYISSCVALCLFLCMSLPNGTSVPNLILAFIPAQINANTLNTMTAFAVCELARCAACECGSFSCGWLFALDRWFVIGRLPTPGAPFLYGRAGRLWRALRNG